MQQKKFMDIQRICLGDEIKAANTGGFKIGDQIQISEKVDGANASFRYDEETGKLVAFSRKNVLSVSNTLRGFLNYVSLLDAEQYKLCGDLIVYGEWLCKHSVVYRQECYGKFYVYDIYDVGRQAYRSHDFVRAFCERMGLEYIHVLYEGEFTGWDDCIAFAKGRSAYTPDGVQMEGVVIKNETTLRKNGEYGEHIPFVLKYVNESFAETKHSNHIRKVLDPQHELEKAHAQEIVDSIVTRNRVQKEIHKMIDEGLLPEKLSPQDMKVVVQNLPKRIYEDCIKEEPESVAEAGEYFGKLCSHTVMKLAREIVIGK